MDEFGELGFFVFLQEGDVIVVPHGHLVFSASVDGKEAVTIAYPFLQKSDFQNWVQVGL